MAATPGRTTPSRSGPTVSNGRAGSPRKRAPIQTEREDITTKLLASFKELLQCGSLVPGAKLPSERELARRFHVSRSSLRQAFKMLDVMGVLSQHVGDGTYLKPNASAILTEPMEFLVLMDGISPHELYEARLTVEPEMAARAAERATAKDVAALSHSLKGMERNPRDMGRFIELDVSFHEAIFRASGNRVFQLMFGAIQRLLLTGIARTAPLVDFAHTLRFHTQIFSAIDRRQPEEARLAMTEHLVDARNVLLAAAEAGQSARLEDRITPIVRSTAFQQVGRRPRP